MPQNKKLVIGLFGFGIVGEGLYKVLKQTPSLNAQIKKVCIKDANKQRNAPQYLFTNNKNELLFDDEINVIVEVINDSDAAFEIVCTALQNGKHAVSASKKMIAEHLEALLILQQQTRKSFLYEAAACASIPVIRNLEEYYDNDLLHSLQGVINGSTNFILTKMCEEEICFDDTLKLAQVAGFAETNPALDVEGYDALYKWILLLNHAYGVVAAPDEVIFSGITNIIDADIHFAAENNFEIKLVAHAKKLHNGKVVAYILPQFVNKDEPLAFVKYEYNGIVLESAFADKQFFYGKGAGSFPTASALLSDIAALRYDYKYEYKKLYSNPTKLSTDFTIDVFISYKSINDIPLAVYNFMQNDIEISNERFCSIVSVPAELLLKNNWWKENKISLIALPQSSSENIFKMKKKCDAKEKILA